MERLYDTRQAGELLGGIHVNDVRNLIASGRLQATVMPIRGRGHRPRQYIKASELQRFIDSLSTLDEARARAKPERRKPRQKRELEQATNYY